MGMASGEVVQVMRDRPVASGGKEKVAVAEAVAERPEPREFDRVVGGIVSIHVGSLRVTSLHGTFPSPAAATARPARSRVDVDVG